MDKARESTFVLCLVHGNVSFAGPFLGMDQQTVRLPALGFVSEANLISVVCPASEFCVDVMLLSTTGPFVTCGNLPWRLVVENAKLPPMGETEQTPSALKRMTTRGKKGNGSHWG
jgi:hypothetical protein